jgi:hypothetical protein
VRVGKDVSERTENFRDTVRNTEVTWSGLAGRQSAVQGRPGSLMTMPISARISNGAIRTMAVHTTPICRLISMATVRRRIRATRPVV